jgi:chromosome segregation protein
LLYFNKLRLTGFKSFVDNTELVIENGLTGVVGPNGCGKSNLVEALRWSMGETSAKQMRGKEMDDVIFGGTDKRPPRNIAEVVLSLSNSERSAPAMFNQFEDLDVSRRIEREKGSTYRVNGKEARARDVQLLFADSSTGARSTAMVSQGRIGAVIAAKPAQRRSLLEEAAGITGLHSRRHEAELRLKSAETNLERLDDILITLDAQLQNLKKQSRQATRYRNLSDHIRKAEATLFHLRWTTAERELDANREQQGKAEETVKELTVLASKASANQAEGSEALPPLRQAEAEAAAHLQRLVVAREGLDEEEARIAEAQASAEARLEQLRADEEREKMIAHDAKQAIARLLAEKEQIEKSREGETENRAQAAAQLQSCNETVASLDTKLGDLTEQVAASEARRNGLANRIRELESRFQRFTARGDEITRQVTELSENSPDTEAVQEAEAQLEKTLIALEEARAARESAELSRTETQEATAEAVSALQDANAVKTRLQAEEQALSRILAASEDDLWPPLVDALTVEPGYETALGAALGEDLSVPTDEAAPAHWRTLPPIDDAPSLPSNIRRLSDVVSGPAALTRRLTQVGVVDSDDEGRALVSSLAQGQRLVSKVGSLWRWDGFTVSSGAVTAAAARLEQRNRLADIRSKLDTTVKAAEEAGANRDRARAKEEAARGGERTAREAVDACDRRFNEFRENLSRVKERANAHSSKIASLSEAGQGNSVDLEEAEAALNEARREFQSIADPGNERDEVGQIRTELAECRADQLASQSRHDAFEREARERGVRLGAIESERLSWQRRQEGSADQLEALSERRVDIGSELELLKAKPAELSEKRSKLLSSIEESENRRNTAADRLQVAENALRTADQTLREAEIALAQAREQMVRMEGAVQQSRQACHAITERVRDRLECRPDQLFEISGLKEDAPLPELEATERKVDRLLRERDTMGPVNLRAEQEAKDMNDQIDSLNEEREDLIQAISKLRHGIAELNREGRTRLLASFKEVDAHFQELFVRLFGGGKAHLALTDSDDPLEAGLEIMASPPGKKLQVLSLLSGGEQALTALSLLFAVFLTNPAPICVLDEVDAPLDDANVDRFCSMLEEMANNEKTRFLVITHHRMTMARMDRLFGVTMSERGVSQLVSVDLQNAERLRDIA